MLVLLHVACPTDGGLIDVLCQGRQTALPHLTSPEAESILAQACENESNNAKRMRMGLEALSVSSKDINRPYRINWSVGLLERLLAILAAIISNFRHASNSFHFFIHSYVQSKAIVVD